MSKCTYSVKYINDSSLKMVCVWVFLSSTLYALYIETKRNFAKPEQREDNSYNLPMGQSKFSNELTFWFISIGNGDKQKSKNTFRVEINQFCDGYRHTMRSSYAIKKM